MPPIEATSEEDLFAGADIDDEDTSGLDFGDDYDPESSETEVEEPAPEPTTETEADEPEEEAADDGDEPNDEPETDEEESSDPEPEEEPEPEPEKPKKIMIPKSRLDDEIAKRRRLEQQLQELQTKPPEPAVPEGPSQEELEEKYVDLMAQANEAVLDGDSKRAASLQREAAALFRTPAPEPTAQTDTASLREEIKEDLRVESILSEARTKYQVFDQDSENFDQALTERAAMFEEAYYRNGYTRSQALERAINDALRLERPDLLEAPSPSPKPKPKPARDVKPDVRRNVKAQNAQPPKAGGISNDASDATRISLDDLSEEEFEALPASKLAELRGDTI